MLTAQRLRELLNYDPETGVFTWAVTKGPRAQAGSVAGSIRTDGYGSVKLDGTHHRLHRLAWLHFYGSFPAGDADHIDGNVSNNAINNLRDVSHQTNMQNRRLSRKLSITGLIGVTVRPNGKFCAQLMTNGKQKHLGLFDTAEEAQGAYLKAKRLNHAGCTI